MCSSGGSEPTASIEANYASIINKGKKGKSVVVLTHEINAHTMHLMKVEYPAIKAAYQHIVPVGTCHDKTHPYRETEYIYPTFDEYTNGHTMPQGIPSANSITAHKHKSIQVGPSAA